jgi:hypothetical protein
MGNELKIALALAAGALYIYVGVRKGDAQNWAFDLLAIVGVLIVAGALYRLFVPGGRRGKQGSATPRPAVSLATPLQGKQSVVADEYSAPGYQMITTLAPATSPIVPKKDKYNAPPSGGPTPFEPDVLSEWTSTLAPGQTSWESTTFSPKESEIAGFAFGGR